MEYTIIRAEVGDEATLAYIQTESWKTGFCDILPAQKLERSIQLQQVTAMYRRVLEQHYANVYMMRVEGEPHCIACWAPTRAADMPGYAELICIHSLPNRWHMGFGSKMMDCVVDNMRAAGYGKVMLWVFADNVRARRFYEANGFCTYGKVKPGSDPVEICYEKNI